MDNWIKFGRTEDARELLKHPNEFVLLAVIAIRASRKGNPILGLQPGEALVGDVRNFGLTEQKYRTAKKNLEKWNFSTFRSTNKGSIAKLCNTDIYDINNEQYNELVNSQPTSSQRAGNEQVTTNKNIKKKRKKEIKHSFSQSPFSDKHKFSEALPDWPKDKLIHYYNAAVEYSESNGAKYLNWIMAVKSWDRRNPWQQGPSKNPMEGI